MKTITFLLALFLLSACAAQQAPPTTEEVVVDHRALAVRLVSQADRAMASADTSSAVFLYTEALAHDDLANIWLRLGVAYERSNDLPRALQAYDTALEKDGELGSAHQQMALIHLEAGRLGMADEAFQSALVVDPSLWRSWNGLGVVSDHREEHAQALEHYRQALDLMPDAALLWNNLGFSAYLAGDFERAENAFNKALEQDPGYQPAWINLGLLQARQKNYRQAVELLSRYRDDAVVYNDIGYVALLNRDWNVAERYIHKAIRSSPRYYPAAQQNLERLVAARDRGLLEQPVDAEVSAAQCSSSRFPEQCRICTQGEDPVRCMLKFLNGLGG